MRAYAAGRAATILPLEAQATGRDARARHDAAMTRRAYHMVVGLWGRGEPVVQPMVARARGALTEMGN